MNQNFNLNISSSEELAESMIDALNDNNSWKSQQLAEECMGDFCDLIACPPASRDFTTLITKILNSERGAAP